MGYRTKQGSLPAAGKIKINSRYQKIAMSFTGLLQDRRDRRERQDRLKR